MKKSIVVTITVIAIIAGTGVILLRPKGATPQPPPPIDMPAGAAAPGIGPVPPGDGVTESAPETMAPAPGARPPGAMPPGMPGSSANGILPLPDTTFPGGGAPGTQPGVDGTADSHRPGADALPRPPDMDRPPLPISMLGQINSHVIQAQRTVGPEVGEYGQGLLDSTNAVLRMAGVAVLAANDGLSEEILGKIASDDDLSVPINAMGWLYDQGHTDAAQLLNESLGSRNLDTQTLLELVDSDGLLESGSRAVLEMLADGLSEEEARAVYESISEDATHAYSVRMKATLLLRDSATFTEFRDTVNTLKNQASADDALWQEGITRLADNLAGPVAVHENNTSLTASDVDEMLAREYPMTLEDLAQHLEYVAGHDEAFIQEGASARLAEHLAELKDRPWTEDQQVSLARIETIATQLAALERPASEAPPGVPQPPPGAGQP